MSLASQRKEALAHLDRARQLLAHSSRFRKIHSTQELITHIRSIRKKLWEAKYALRAGQQ